MDRIRDWLEKHVFPDGVNYYFIPSCYTFGGLIFFIAIPSYIFTIMEGTKQILKQICHLLDRLDDARCDLLLVYFSVDDRLRRFYTVHGTAEQIR